MRWSTAEKDVLEDISYGCWFSKKCQEVAVRLLEGLTSKYVYVPSYDYWDADDCAICSRITGHEHPPVAQGDLQHFDDFLQKIADEEWALDKAHYARPAKSILHKLRTIGVD